MDLHRQMGQLALREAGLFDDFQEHSLPGAEAMKLIKSGGRVFWDEDDSNNAASGHSGDQPDIDRATLRDILVDSLQLNRKLIRVESTDWRSRSFFSSRSTSFFSSRT